MAQADKAAKMMSSRLANMKFMQRASIGSAASSPRTPAEHPAKRQRLSNGTAISTPATPYSPHGVATPQESEDASGGKKKYSTFQGESEWYLDVKEQQSPAAAAKSGLRIVSAGYSTIDAALPTGSSSVAEEEGDVPTAISHLSGRRSFGKFNKSIEKQQNIKAGESDYSSDSSDDEEYHGDGNISDDPTGAKAMILQSRKEATERARAERKAKRKSDGAESTRLAEERRKKEVNLNRLTSISAGGSGTNTPSRQNSLRDVTCYKCHEKGHVSRDCPRWATSRLRRD